MSSNLLATSTVDIKGALDQYATQQPVQTNITPVLADIINAVIIIAALLFLFYLLLGALGWITAGGDKGKIESARNKIVQGLVGLGVTVFAYTFYLFIINYLGIGLGQGSGITGSGGSETGSKQPATGNKTIPSKLP